MKHTPISTETLHRRVAILETMGFECFHNLLMSHPKTGYMTYDFSAIAEDQLLKYGAQLLVERGKEHGRLTTLKHHCDCIGAAYSDQLRDDLELYGLI